MRPARTGPGWARIFGRDRAGSAGVEFAMLSPAFCLLLVGTIDFGSVLHTRFRLDSAVSAGANFAVVNATKVTAADGPGLASSIASILSSSSSSNGTTGTVVVNNGPQSTLANGVATPGGTAGNADSCYCPSLVSGAISWGVARTCGTACTGGGLAGKFVTISAQQAYSPSFSNYGIVSNGTISSRVVVQTQ